MKKKKVYDGKNFTVSFYDFILEGKKTSQEIIEQSAASLILAFEGKNIILVKQYRFPVGYTLEIPAGHRKKRESARDCAIREIQEETGYKPKKMKRLITFYPYIGYNLSFFDCFVATELIHTGNPKLDDDESVTVVKMDFKKLLKMIKAGKILDSKTICAALTYAAKEKISF